MKEREAGRNPRPNPLSLAALVSTLLVGSLSATWFYRFTPVSAEIGGGGKLTTWYDQQPELPPPVPGPERGACLLIEGELLSAAIGTTIVQDWGVAIGAELCDISNVKSHGHQDVTFLGALLPACYLTKGIGSDHENEGPVFSLSGRVGLGYTDPVFGDRVTVAATFETGSAWWKYGMTAY